MALPLILLYTAMGTTAYVTDGKLQESAAKNGMKFTEYGGVETPKLLGGLGVLGLLFGPPIVAAVGAGLVVGALDANRTVTTVREAVVELANTQMKRIAEGGGGAPTLQIPGPATVPPVRTTTVWDLPKGILDRMMPSRAPTPVPTP